MWCTPVNNFFLRIGILKQWNYLNQW
jgi:hypothetical protein